jgi:Fe-S-cluster containining protein
MPVEWEQIGQDVKIACDNCQALCCRKLIIEADEDDVRREPRIADEWKQLKGWEMEPYRRWCWVGIKGGPCPFLDESNRCGIYDTRPGECRCFRVGGQHCRDLRETYGVDPAEVAQGKLEFNNV